MRRVLKPHLRGVQRLPRKGPRGLLQRRLTRPVAGAGSVGGVAQHGVAEEKQVNTDLMRAARLQSQFQQAEGTPRFEHPVMAARFPAAACHNGHFLALGGVSANRRVDCSLLRRHRTMHQRLVAPLQLSRLELRRQMAMAAVVLGHHQQPGGVLVQPVDDARALLAADAREWDRQ